MSQDAWDPEQYQRFARERSQPFYDMLELVEPAEGLRAVDLGCGTGELTAALHERLRARETLGLDSSPAMLERAAAHARPDLRFARQDVAAWDPPDEGYDLVFSNAALQWVPDHPALFTRLARALAPGGQLAVQMPANFDQPSHRVASQLALESPFREALGGYRRDPPVLPPEAYAALLHELGFSRQLVRLQVYGHVLADRRDVVEWVKGTLLTDYKRRMEPSVWDRFLGAYDERLTEITPDRHPFFFPFKRLLVWGRR